MNYNRSKVSRIFPYEQRWTWGPIFACCLVPTMVAIFAGAPDEVAGGIAFGTPFIALVVSLIGDPGDHERRARPDA